MRGVARVALPSMIETAVQKGFSRTGGVCEAAPTELGSKQRSKQKSWKSGARDAVRPSRDSQLPWDRHQPPRDVQHPKEPKHIFPVIQDITSLSPNFISIFYRGYGIS